MTKVKVQQKYVLNGSKVKILSVVLLYYKKPLFQNTPQRKLIMKEAHLEIIELFSYHWKS